MQSLLDPAYIMYPGFPAGTAASLLFQLTLLCIVETYRSIILWRLQIEGLFSSYVFILPKWLPLTFTLITFLPNVQKQPSGILEQINLFGEVS